MKRNSSLKREKESKFWLVDVYFFFSLNAEDILQNSSVYRVPYLSVFYFYSLDVTLDFGGRLRWELFLTNLTGAPAILRIFQAPLKRW